MIKYIKSKYRLYQTKFSFGATSGVITILSLITGLDTLTHPKMSIMGGILLVALADNISDSLGIHIYQESECLDPKEVWISTFTNFITRLFVSMTFVFLVAALPIKQAVIFSVAWGLLLLTVMSYSIARDRKVNPYTAIFEHLVIAVSVIVASHFLGGWIIGKFKP